MIHYKHYTEDAGLIISLLAKHQKTKQDISGELVEAMKMSCEWFSKIIREKKFISWVDSPITSRQLNSEEEFKQVVELPTYEIFKKCERLDYSTVKKLTEDAKLLINKRINGEEPEPNQKLQDIVETLQKEICAEKAMIEEDFRALEGTPGSKEYKTAKKRARSSKRKKIMNKLWTGMLALGFLFGLYRDIKEEVDEGNKNPKIEIVATPNQDIVGSDRHFWTEAIKSVPHIDKIEEDITDIDPEDGSSDDN